ncbi:formate dehydrogenase accessory sulfurtransferase FdhD, partial [Bacillus sp. B-TM1]
MDLEFLTSVLMIVGIDVVLGGDNAIVIALASRNLPESKRNKAILIGTLLAIVLRIVLTILAVYLLDIPFLQLIGGVLLTLIAVNLLTDNSNDLSSIQGKIIAFSGRISSEILLKVSKIGCEIVLSKSAPTKLALQLAHDLGITVVGFIRNESCNIYTHPHR